MASVLNKVLDALRSECYVGNRDSCFVQLFKSSNLNTRINRLFAKVHGRATARCLIYLRRYLRVPSEKCLGKPSEIPTWIRVRYHIEAVEASNISESPVGLSDGLVCSTWGVHEHGTERNAVNNYEPTVSQHG